MSFLPLGHYFLACKKKKKKGVLKVGGGDWGVVVDEGDEARVYGGGSTLTLTLPSQVF